MHHLSITPLDVDVPKVDPRYDAPFFQGFQLAASYILGVALIVVLIMLIMAIAALAMKTLAPERARTWAGEAILPVSISAVALGCVSAIFAWLVNFNFGF